MCQLDSLGSRHWDRHGGAKVCKRAGHVKDKKASDHLVQSLTTGCCERNLTMAWNLSQIWKKPAERGCPVTSLSQLDSYSFFEEMWCEFQCISLPVMVRHLHLGSQPIRREILHGSGLPPFQGRCTRVTQPDETDSVSVFDSRAAKGIHYLPPSQLTITLPCPQLPPLLVSVDFWVVLSLPLFPRGMRRQC